VRTDILTLLK